MALLTSPEESAPFAAGSLGSSFAQLSAYKAHTAPVRSFDERQDGYRQHSVGLLSLRSGKLQSDTPNAATSQSSSTSSASSSSSAISFSNFIQSMLLPNDQTATDPHLLIPIAAADPRDVFLISTSPHTMPTSDHRITRSEDLQYSTPLPQDDNTANIELLSSDVAVGNEVKVAGDVHMKRKRRRSPSPAADDSGHSSPAELMNNAKKTKKDRSSPSVSSLTVPRAKRPTRSPSRERSASRQREFRLQHSHHPLSIEMIDEDDGTSSLRKRKFAPPKEEELSPEDDSSSDEFQPLNAFSVISRKQRHFRKRMARERLRFQDLLSDFGYVVRLDETEEEAQRIQEEVIRETTPTPCPDDDTFIDPLRRSRRDRNRKDTMDWMKLDNAYIRADIERIRKAMQSEEIYKMEMAAPLVSSAANSPVPNPGSPGDGRLAINPPSPTFSLATLSPPSSRSTSPEPRSQAASDCSSPAHSFNGKTVLPSSNFIFDSTSSVYHSPPALAAVTPKKASELVLQSLPPQSHPEGTYLVEAILAHRPLHSKASPSSFDLHYQQWMRGVAFEYKVKWLGFKQPTWEPQANVGDYMVTEYWNGRGTTHLWTEDEIETLASNVRS